MSNSYLWTSEYVSAGHPDKVADQVSDAILDAYLAVDATATVACECMIKSNTVYVAGEIGAAQELDLEPIIRKTICDIGYNSAELGFDGKSCEIVYNLSQQSREINAAVIHDAGISAGDQGIMFGYATKQTPTAMPVAIYLAREILRTADALRRSERVYRPDMKSQVSLRIEDGRTMSIDNLVLSTCHREDHSIKQIHEYFHDRVLPTFLAALSPELQTLFGDTTTYYINPAGAWNMGGPVSDCGLTGRKIVVDQYGADCPIGGGAFSGKDPSKIDRSGAYAARYLAKKVLMNSHAETVCVQLAYIIGKKEPSSIRVFNPLNGESLVTPDAELVSTLEIGNIIERFGLRQPMYLETARNGHFGCEPFWRDGVDYYRWEDESVEL